MIKLWHRILCKLNKHKTVIVSVEQYYKIICLRCNQQWDE